MRIVVPIKQVPETNAVKMDEATGTMVREGVEAIINPLDLYAIEIAIRLRESQPAGAGEVIAVSMGPPKAITALREAIAMGCDSAVLVSDKAFAGSDTWATSYVLAAAVKKIGQMDMFGCHRPSPYGSAGTPAHLCEPQEPTGNARTGAPKGGVPVAPGTTPLPDIVICGERATDGDTGQVGPGIAAFLDLPVASYISKVESVGCHRSAGTPARLCDRPEPTGNARTGAPNDGAPVAPSYCKVHRMVEDGYEVLEIQTPCVLTVVKEVADPRLPTLRGKQKARAATIPTWGPNELGLERGLLGLDGSPTRVVKIFKPSVTRKCEKFVANDDASINAAADKLVEFLKSKELI
jgi:electron transfer flavoprotein beta subunit